MNMRRILHLTSTSLIGVMSSFVAQGAMSGAIPDPEQCEAEPWDELGQPIMCPNFRGVGDQLLIPAATVRVKVRNINGQSMANVPVVLYFEQDDQDPEIPLFCLSWEELSQGTTDLFGEVELFAAASGCMDIVQGSEQAILAFFEGDWYLIKAWLRSQSPDSETRMDLLQVVDLVDLVRFSCEFDGSCGGDCHDYDNNATTGLSDLILFGPAFDESLRCTAP